MRTESQVWTDKDISTVLDLLFAEKPVTRSEVQFTLNSMRVDYETQMNALRAQLERAQAELAERDAAADLRHEADMRAIAIWQEATGKELMWPSHDDLCVWLMERVAELEAA